MGMSATSFSGSGLRDWLLQRATAIILAAYLFYFLGYLFTHSPMDFDAWQSLFHDSCMQVATTLVLIAIITHAWIGVWTVFGDYVKCWCLRLTLNFALFFGLLTLLVWGLAIIWST